MFNNDIMTKYKETLNFSVEERNWAFFRKIFDLKTNPNFSNKGEKIFEFFKLEIAATLEDIAWSKENEAIRLTKRTLKTILDLESKNKALFNKSLLNGRFDKNDCHLEHSVIVGDNGGLYILLNSIENKNIGIIVRKRQLIS